MSEQDIEQLDSLNQPTEEVVQNQVVEETVAETATEEAEPSYSEREQKLRLRAREAEAALKKLKTELKAKEKVEPTPQDSNVLSQKDLIAVLSAKIPAEDIDEVVDYAKLKKIPVVEALKTNVVKTILNERAEERRTAEATSTGNQKRGTAKVSDEALLDKAQKGELPDDYDSLVRIAKQRKGLK